FDFETVPSTLPQASLNTAVTVPVPAKISVAASKPKTVAGGFSVTVRVLWTGVLLKPSYHSVKPVAGTALSTEGGAPQRRLSHSGRQVMPTGKLNAIDWVPADRE